MGQISVNMRQLDLNVERMFENADAFFLSLKLPSNEMSYKHPNAILEKPEGTMTTCNSVAWDFCKNNDFRVTMCASLTFEDYKTVHRVLGYAQYYQQYTSKPYLFKDAANPAFFEAIGNVIALAFANPEHLKNVS